MSGIAFDILTIGLSAAYIVLNCNKTWECKEQHYNRIGKVCLNQLSSYFGKCGSFQLDPLTTF